MTTSTPRSLAFAAAALALVARADPAGDAAAACAQLNLTAQLTLMRGFGPIAGYSRNSGCAGVCGRATYRWDNGPQGESIETNLGPHHHHCTLTVNCYRLWRRH